MDARIEQTQNLQKEVGLVRFAHGKRLDGLKELHIETIRDLLNHYPFRYDDFSQISKIIDLPLGQKHAVMGTIHQAQGRKTARGGYLFEITLVDETGMLKAVWFNQRWLADTLTVGKELLLLGKAEHYNGFLNMTSPLYTLIAKHQVEPGMSDEDSSIAHTDAGIEPVGIVPVYRANSKVSSNWIKRFVLESRKLVSEPLDPLPAKLRMRRRLVSRQIAWHDIHTPANAEDLRLAHNRLAYEQVFWAQLIFAYAEHQLIRGLPVYEHLGKTSTNRNELNTASESSDPPSEEAPLLDALTRSLPFELTQSQQQAINEIQHDMRSTGRMNRLLLGDVGSGKTVVALHALTTAVQSGWQAAMMAPTEVLAFQYAQSAGSYLEGIGISWALLTSSTSETERTRILEELASGSLQVIFGTHALIEPQVVFRDLSLIVVDEQHRFGVEHRKALIAKSPAADFLSMTATPIPRSLALVLYGAIEVSYLENRPQKARTTTYCVDSSVSYKAYEAVRQALKRGEQAFIVCPLISAPQPSDEDEADFLDDLEGFVDEPYIAAAEAELQHLRQQVFPEHHIELLTSRVKSVDKQRIMDEYKAGRIAVLVSTTVIEVGVDVPNATVMIVLDADRFGLAQLHQLRGRVGRGTKDAQMFLVSHNPSEGARRRLKLLEKHSDGITLAKADLKERREGDIAGVRQHGSSELSLINVVRDSALIEAAHQDVAEILTHDSSLSKPEHQALRFELDLRGEVSVD